MPLTTTGGDEDGNWFDNEVEMTLRQTSFPSEAIGLMPLTSKNFDE